jgi:hypothetical protein
MSKLSLLLLLLLLLLTNEYMKTPWSYEKSRYEKK